MPTLTKPQKATQPHAETPSAAKLKVKRFMDGANINDMRECYRQGIVQGFTTNPSLMRKAAITDYGAFAREALAAIPDLPISFEVFSDDPAGMEREARKIATWGRNVYVKIPITNTQGRSCVPLISALSKDAVRLNVTAILTLEQVAATAEALDPKIPSIVSVFAGRIADTGRDPMPLMREAAQILKANKTAELLWASSRELLNIFQAEACRCHIITVTPEILKKLSTIGKDLGELSLDTVKMFYKDAQSAGYKI
ncbi:MAG: transaldolase [Elusimicrobia bacterium]|nr:transaldolase [Elusimicrobiota bacterium]